MTFEELPKAVADLLDSVNEIKQFLKTKPEEVQSKPDHVDKPMNIDQAADFLNTTKGSLYGLVHQRKVPFSKRGKRLYFYEKELRQWIQSGRRQTVQEITDEAINALSFKP